MIDTVGYGIYRMTKSQRNRYLPLPDYQKTSSQRVVLEVLGRPIDERYSQLLLERSDLDIDTVILLDRVQKKLPITEEAIARLRRNGLIEGRMPNIHVTASIAEATGTQASYTQSKGVADDRLKALLIEHLRKFTTGTSRPDIDSLLAPLLPKSLSAQQRKDKITNLLSSLKRVNALRSEGRGPGARWFVSG